MFRWNLGGAHKLRDIRASCKSFRLRQRSLRYPRSHGHIGERELHRDSHQGMVAHTSSSSSLLENLRRKEFGFLVLGLDQIRNLL